MAGGTRIARLKILEGDSVSKNKARKNKKLTKPSLSNKKLETKGKKAPESPVTRSARKESGASPSTCADSKKCASPIIKHKRREDGRTRYSSTFDKSSKIASTPTKRKKEDSRTVSSSSNNSFSNPNLQTKKRKVNDLNKSSSSNNSIRSASPPTRKRKVDDLHGSSQFTTCKNEKNDKKIVKKHLHVKTYKKLLTKGAKKVGGRDDHKVCFKEKRSSQRVLPSSSERVSKEAQEDVGLGNLVEDLQEKRETMVKTSDPLEKEELNNVDSLDGTLETNTPPSVNTEHLSKLGGYKYGRAANNRKSDVLVKQSRKEVTNLDGSPTNTKLSPLTRQELAVRDDGFFEAECCGTTIMHIAERNTSVDPEKCTATYQTVAALPDLCLVCRKPGLLMCCGGKGCKQSYHLSCLDPPLNDVPLGVWLCNNCIEKRMKSGIYSVSGGIESVWDVDDGMQSEKRYFVKYKDLSHVHNVWVPESQLLLEAPSLFAKISKKNQKEKVKKWRKEWAEPERLLQKRLLSAPKVADKSKSGANSSHCCVEWLVKWKGLGYDQATWEAENLLHSFSSEVVKLIEEYQHRREHAKRSYDQLRIDEALQVKKDPFHDLSKLPEGCPAELDMDHLNCVNRLREFWHKSQNAVLIDDKDRISKSVLFVLALQSNACCPSLIITTLGTIPLWEAEFVRLAPSLSVIKYLGSKDIRKMIQKLEFYEESGCLMPQVLLSDPDAVVEDLGDLTCIGWEAVIVDECQNSKTSSYLEQFKGLNADFKVLIFNGQLKGSLSQFLNFLSFVGTGEEDDCLSISDLDNGETVDLVGNLREKLMCHVAYERKADTSKFLEYWVPVPLSNVQLEEYCETLISNSDVLRSNSRSNIVGAIHDVVMATKRCCDHPYLVDGELRNSLTRGLQGIDFFNAEVHASGKLLLLEKILQEMKSRGLRVVIIFQSAGGPEKISLGDILDDFLQQRFGVDSYERIETRLIMSKKLTAQNMFNDRKTGRFVFLIESRACLPSVKLCSVDVVMLFNSDWNPFNDLRGLQKITFQPQNNCIRVFRLYTAFTVEEKLLIHAKHDTPLESNIQSISRNVTHSLLAWGASNLFRKLDGFHLNARTTCISETSSDMNLLNDVISEILEELIGETQTNRTVPCFVNKVSMNGASYSENIVLVGEKEDVIVPDKDIPNFWSSLLEGRHPKWLYISKPSQRIRRKIYNLNEPMNLHEAESDEVKKHRKINSIGEPFTSINWSQGRRDAVKDDISQHQKSHMLKSQAGEPKLEEQRTLLMLLRPELVKLCDILHLPDAVKSMAEEYLEYIMNNHDVSSKQVTVLQALKISLCWRAASMLRHNLDRLESLALARRYLDYECTEEEAFSVYSRLRILKEKFSYRTVVLKDVKVQNSLNYHPEKADAANEALHRTTEMGASDTSVLGVTGRVSDGHKSSKQTQQENHAILQTHDKFLSDIRPLKDQLVDGHRDLIDKVCLGRSEELTQKNQAELSQFESEMNEKLKLVKAYSLDLELVRSIHTDSTVIKGKVILLTQQLSKKMERFREHRKQQHERLASMQFDMQNNEQGLKKRWLEKAKAGQLEGSFDNIPLPVTGSIPENMKETSELAIAYHSGITMHSTVGSSDQTKTHVDGAPTGNSIECRIQSNTENLILETEALASQSTLDDLATIEQNHTVEQLGIPLGLAGVLPIDIEVPAHQPEFSNLLSCEPDELITDSIILTDKDADSGGPTIAAASRNNLELTSSTEVTIPVSQSVTLSLQDESRSPNGANVLESALHLLPQAEHEERVTPASNPEELACSRAHCCSRQSEVTEQHTILSAFVENVQSNEQILENIVHPLDSMDDPPPQRLPYENLRNTGIQSDPQNHLSQNFQTMDWVPPQAIYADPFQNELYRIHKQDDLCTKKHEDKKLRLQLEFEEEIAKVRRKYDALIQDSEREYLHEKKILAAIYDKVLLHKVLAEELRVKFYYDKGASTSFKGSNQSLIQQLQASASSSQPQLTLRPSSTPPPVPPLTATTHPRVLTTNQPSTSSSLTTTRQSNPPLAVASFQSAGPSCQSSLLLSSNIGRGSTPRAILPVGRAPAPHLQRFRQHMAVPVSNSPLSATGPITTLASLIPSSNMVSALPAAFLPVKPSFSQVHLPQFVGAELESLPSNLSSIGNEVPSSTMTNSRSIASSDFVYLSDDE